MDSSSQYLSAVKTIFPNQKNWQEIDHGWDHLVYVNDNFVVRFPKRLDNKESFLREFKLLQFLSDKVPLRIPQMKLNENLKNNLIAVSYPLISGVKLSPEYLANLDQNEKKLIAKELGNFFLKLHSIDYNKIIPLGYEAVNQQGFAEYIENLIKKLEESIFKEMPSNLVEIIIEYSKKYIQSVRKYSFPLVITHADIQAEHIYYNGKLEPRLGIIDFGDVRINDPAYDFGYLNFYGSDFYNKLIQENYPLAKDKDFDIRSKFNGIRFLIGDLDEQQARGEDWKKSWHYKILVKYLNQLNKKI